MSMRVCTIASGSKGNCTYVTDGSTELFIDCGIGKRAVQSAVKALGGTVSNMNILVTHSHSDHIGGVASALRSGGTAYIHESCASDCKMAGLRGNIALTRGRFSVGDISVLPFRVSHDVPCVGYTLRKGSCKISIVTDLGYLPPETMDCLIGSDLVILESNYDDSLLKMCKYPIWLKRRISSSYGHLSNSAAADVVAQLAENGAQHVILAHLSENSNTPSAALAATNEVLAERGLCGKIKVSLASQHCPSALYEVD